MAEPVDAAKSPEELIRDFEKCVVAGDIAGMAKIIGQWHDNWSGISEATKREILTLEAIFLSMVKLRAKPTVSPQ
jgi:hypothetical protein